MILSKNKLPRYSKSSNNNCAHATRNPKQLQFTKTSATAHNHWKWNSK
jgi:hypothetical protein